MPKIVFVGRMGWLVGNTKTKGKKLKKSLKTSKINISKNGKKLFPIVLKNIFPKN